MPKFSLNPMKGVTLKNPVGWIRKTINGMRVRQVVDFKAELFQGGDVGRMYFRDPDTGRTYNWNAYNIVDLATTKNERKDWVDTTWKIGAQQGKNLTKAEALNLLTERFNLYMKYTGWKLPVAYIYSRKSRVIRGSESLIAVRLKDGSKGWLTAEGRFIGQDTMRELLYDVDQTLPASTSDISLMDAWDAMSPQQKADFADIMQDFDWDQFWEEIGSDDPARDLSAATNAYYDLIEIMGDVLGW